MVKLGFLAEDRDAMLEVRKLDIGDHPPLEAAHEAGLESGNVGGRSIAREHDLPTSLVERVEGVKEFFLRRFLALEELHVVYEQKIRFAEAAPKLMRRTILNRSDELVRELLGADEGDSGVRLSAKKLVRDRLHQVRLPDTSIPVDEQRVVNARWRLGHRVGGRRSELVRLSNNEVSKGVAFAQGRRVTAAVVGCAWLSLNRRRSNEQIHLRSRFSLFVHAKHNG